jgi:hypothetical protein
MTHGESGEASAVFGEDAPGAGEEKKSPHLALGVCDAGLETDPVELPQAWEIFRTSVSQDRVDAG